MPGAEKRDEKPADPPAAGADRRHRGKRASARRGAENVIGAFLLAVLVGGAIVWSESGRCPGALRPAAQAAALIAIPIAVVIAAVLASADRTAGRAEKIARGAALSVWAAAAALAMVTGLLLVMNERGPRTVARRNCLISRRETVPARVAGVGDWVVVLRCSGDMSPVRVDVDRRSWWENETGGTVHATVARGRLGFEWVVDTELGPPVHGFTRW